MDVQATDGLGRTFVTKQTSQNGEWVTVLPPTSGHLTIGGSLTTLSTFCPTCGKPRTYVGDYFGGEPPWCECKPALGHSLAALATPPAPAPWRCPGCGKWQAPHTARCDCQGEAE